MQRDAFLTLTTRILFTLCYRVVGSGPTRPPRRNRSALDCGIRSPEVGLGLNSTTGNSVVATPNITTTYNVIGTDINNCSDVISANITVNPLPNVSVIPAIASICEGSVVSVNAFGANTYSWSPAVGLNTSVGNTVVASPQSTMDYIITGFWEHISYINHIGKLKRKIINFETNFLEHHMEF